MLLTGHSGGNHVEVAHVVTRRGLMALGTVDRAWRWMAEIRDRPVRRQVTLNAIVSKEPVMRVLGAMTRFAVEHGFKRRDAWMSGWRFASRLVVIDPGTQPLIGLITLFRNLTLFDLPQSNLGKSLVVHVGRSLLDALVFRMAFGAARDSGVKGRRLTLE